LRLLWLFNALVQPMITTLLTGLATAIRFI
jgi:hypothetical protein